MRTARPILACLLAMSSGAPAAAAPAPADPAPTEPAPARPEPEPAPAAPAGASPAAGERRGNFAVVPGPFYNPSLGLGLQIIPMAMFHPDADDAVSPPSVAMLTGLYAVNPPLSEASTRQSWFLGSGTRLFLAEDRWRVQAFGAYLDLFQQFYGIGGATSSDPLFHYRMGGILFFVQPMRQVLVKELYLGVLVGYTAFRARADDPADQAVLDGLGTGASWTGQPNLGIAAQYDTQNSKYYPSAGVDVNLRVNGSVKSGQEYAVLAPSVNHYLSLSGGNRVVLAYRVFAQLGFGELPLGSYARYGSRGTTLGYTTGEYMDKMMAGGEAELRWLAWRRVGLEGGVGAGKVFADLGSFGPEPWLPGAWGSLTYKVMEAQDIRARMTVAVGKTGGAFYFGVGQNF